MLEVIGLPGAAKERVAASYLILAMIMAGAMAQSSGPGAGIGMGRGLAELPGASGGNFGGGFEIDDDDTSGPSIAFYPFPPAPPHPPPPELPVFNAVGSARYVLSEPGEHCGDACARAGRCRKVFGRAPVSRRRVRRECRRTW